MRKASSTEIFSERTSVLGTKIKKPEVGFGVVGIKIETLSS
jgi:hypothetical protein